MLKKFNSFIEKWMALVTPTCLLVGVCFPDIAKCGLPYVPAVNAFLTFAAVRFLLSVKHFTMIAVPLGPYPSYVQNS